MVALTIADAIALAQQNPTLRIEPVRSTVTVGQGFTVSVVIDEASDLGGFQFDLRYISATVTADDVTLGDFLGSTGRDIIKLGAKIDNDDGKITFGAASFGINPGPDGTGTLALITFTGQEEGESDLEFQRVRLADTSGNPQTPTVEHGWVRVVTPRPVGGIIVPVNKLEILALRLGSGQAPWLGLVAVASFAALAFAFWVQRDHW